MERLKTPAGIFVLAALAGIFLFVVGWLRNANFEYWYLIYNLFLGVLPLGFAIWWRKLFIRYSWKNWRSVLVGILWLLFLPNSFYIITDFIHLYETPRVDVVQDVVMLMQFSLLGLIFGFMSLLIIHQEAVKLIGSKKAMYGAGLVLLLSSFAIHLGRELRWNSWDVLFNPFGLLGDVLRILLAPFASAAIWTTLSFFLFLTSFYALWRVVMKNRNY